jgi:hypothetical protein
MERGGVLHSGSRRYGAERRLPEVERRTDEHSDVLLTISVMLATLVIDRLAR